MLTDLMSDNFRRTALGRVWSKVFLNGIFDGLGVATLVWQGRPAARRYVSRGIEGDWRRVGGEIAAAIQTVEHGK